MKFGGWGSDTSIFYRHLRMSYFISGHVKHIKLVVRMGSNTFTSYEEELISSLGYLGF